MRFEFYSDAIADVPKLSVDGTVDNAIHFSHWHGNQTPESVKADTSTETVLNVIAAPNRNELTRSIDLVTNNHFDTDGVLSVWAMLTGERALDLRVTEIEDAKLSVVTLAREVFGPSGFDPNQHSAPFTAISHHARGELFLIATPVNGSWAYRIDYPYYSWAETVVRPRIERRDLGPLMTLLNELDTNSSGHWRLDTSELASAAKFSDENGRLGASSLGPDEVANT